MKLVLSGFLFFLGIVLFNLTAAATHHFPFDEDIERDFNPPYLSKAYGPLPSLRSPQVHSFEWPVSVLSIGHTIASYQNYGMGISGAYFHHGIDIRADAGSAVTAVTGGRVINIENYAPGDPAYWEIAIQDNEGYIWQYHHIDHRSIPREIRDALSSGTPIAAGSHLGNVFYWSVVTFGERYHHIHLNVLGTGKTYLNPFAFLKPLSDTSKPQIHDIALFKEGKKVSGHEISGAYTLVARIEDLILSDKFLVPANEVTIEIDGKAAQSVWTFDKLPGGSSNKLHVNELFVPSLTCGNYECRRLYIDLGFNTLHRSVFPSELGMHDVRVVARDFAGNETAREFAWRIVP